MQYYLQERWLKRMVACLVETGFICSRFRNMSFLMGRRVVNMNEEESLKERIERKSTSRRFTANLSLGQSVIGQDRALLVWRTNCKVEGTLSAER